MENLIGKKIKGFKFDIKIGNCQYTTLMDKYVGKIGVLEKSENEKLVKIRFQDGTYWNYPIDQIQNHLIKEDMKFKLGQKVWDKSISDNAGVVTGFDLDEIVVEFASEPYYYELNGENQHGQKTLSSTEYTYLGFSQEEIIERGSLVYFRDDENDT